MESTVSSARVTYETHRFPIYGSKSNGFWSVIEEILYVTVKYSISTSQPFYRPVTQLINKYWT